MTQPVPHNPHRFQNAPPHPLRGAAPITSASPPQPPPQEAKPTRPQPPAAPHPPAPQPPQRPQSPVDTATLAHAKPPHTRKPPAWGSGGLGPPGKRPYPAKRNRPKADEQGNPWVRGRPPPGGRAGAAIRSGSGGVEPVPLPMTAYVRSEER